jgi:hypothetical protein
VFESLLANTTRELQQIVRAVVEDEVVALVEERQRLFRDLAIR